MKPSPKDYHPYYKMYIDLIDSEDIVSVLENQIDEFNDFAAGLTAYDFNRRYSEGKWSVKEIIVHLIDTERIFVYRMLSAARNDGSDLKSFDQEFYVSNSDCREISHRLLIEDFINQRKSTISFLRTLTDEMWHRKGDIGGYPFNVSAGAYIIAGHFIHHINFIKENYF
ncbi:hypothetical protein MROS_1347 [Melioribacter roseus P3M-2]|uniref:DinB-like domain-containing protein n=1 Tax=Melioribacter roseus (strain DSM 23840 / JCM 17771 / VKM B-2668 / P3M-2) TaxID=1191523 RepID=I6ZR93_MELRP|nr:DinB family protein [Melioribacter roseus]AFN74584.1 hypothetical protein MROS_1347 [Melioribacter roseus P3M-2]